MSNENQVHLNIVYIKIWFLWIENLQMYQLELIYLDLLFWKLWNVQKTVMGKYFSEEVAIRKVILKTLNISTELDWFLSRGTLSPANPI